jgi:hypothetical protein
MEREPLDDLQSQRHVDMKLPLPTKFPQKRRPQSYREFLVVKLKNSPVRPTLRQRVMVPVRHVMAFSLVLIALGLLFLGLGYFFWRIILPESYSVQSPDANLILLAGWVIVVAVFALGIFLSWLQTISGFFCCGKGLNKTLE